MSCNPMQDVISSLVQPISLSFCAELSLKAQKANKTLFIHKSHADGPDLMKRIMSAVLKRHPYLSL